MRPRAVALPTPKPVAVCAAVSFAPVSMPDASMPDASMPRCLDTRREWAPARRIATVPSGTAFVPARALRTNAVVTA